MNIRQSHASRPMTMDSVRLERERKTKWELKTEAAREIRCCGVLRVLHGKRASDKRNRNTHTHKIKRTWVMKTIWDERIGTVESPGKHS